MGNSPVKVLFAKKRMELHVGRVPDICGVTSSLCPASMSIFAHIVHTVAF